MSSLRSQILKRDVTILQGADRYVGPLDPKVRHEILNAPCMALDNVVDLFNRHHDQAGLIDQVRGLSIRPPFRQIWFEFNPTWDYRISRVGIHAAENRDAETMRGVIWIALEGHICHLSTVTLHTATAGGPCDFESLMTAETFPEISPEEEAAVARYAARDGLDPLEFTTEAMLESTLSFTARCSSFVVLALALCHCKNVDVADVHVGGRRRKKNKKREVVWKRLVIPGESHPSRSRRDPSGDENRLHVCRGHFKTYTAAAPLLGRHVGTYWWEAHVRGNEELGTVHKTYAPTLPDRMAD